MHTYASYVGTPLAYLSFINMRFICFDVVVFLQNARTTGTAPNVTMQLASSAAWTSSAAVFQADNKIQANMGFVVKFSVSASGDADSMYFFVGSSGLPTCEAAVRCSNNADVTGGGWMVVIDILAE
jgi:hypothetical protein